ncbi:MAG: TfoX/Sxy family protein [Chloroflexota bacterium]
MPTNDRIPDLKLGPVSAGWLREIGIESADDLKRVGVVEAYRRVKANHPREATLNLLYGLEAAVAGIHWNALPPERKAELKREAQDF